MICYMAKRKADGFLNYRYISAVPVDTVGPRWEGWTLVPVEIREYNEARKKLEDAAPALLAACKEAIKTLGDFMQDHYGQNQHVLGWHLNGDPEPMDSFLEADNFHETIEALLSAIAKVEGK